MSVMQMVVVAVTVGLNALDGYDVLSSAFASTGIRAEWGVSQAELGFVLAAEFSNGKRRHMCVSILAMGYAVGAPLRGDVLYVRLLRSRTPSRTAGTSSGLPLRQQKWGPRGPTFVGGEGVRLPAG